LDHPVGRVGAVVTNGQAGTTGKLVARLPVLLPDTIDSGFPSVDGLSPVVTRYRTVISRITTMRINRIDDFTMKARANPLISSCVSPPALCNFGESLKLRYRVSWITSG